MGNYLGEPIVDFGECENGQVPDEGDYIYWAQASVQGWRKTQQDFLVKAFNLTSEEYIDTTELDAAKEARR